MATYAISEESVPWRTSSYSGTGGGQCVEVAPGSELVAVRDSKAPHGVVLTFSPDTWTDFLRAAVRDEL